LLLMHEHDGQRALYQLDIASGELTLVREPHNWISAAAFAPSGDIWLREESTEQAPQVATLDGNIVLSAPGPTPPPGRPHRSVRFDGADGNSTHMFVTTPPG